MDAGQILLKHGLLSDSDLTRAVDARTNGARVDQLAVEMGLVGEADALRALGLETGVDFLDLEGASVDLSLLQTFPPKLIHRHGLFPIERRRGAVVVATSDPLNLYPLDEAAAALGCPVIPVVATREAIGKRIKTHLGVGSETIEGLLAQREEEEVELVDGLQVEDGEIAAEVQEASVVHLVNEILLEAIDSRASDVHIESQPSGVKVRYRIDKGKMEFSLEKLGMAPQMKATFDRLIRMPHGIILVTGPTGSGKTTTLYSALVGIKSEDTKIITTEDPVEYQLEGINQIQVHPKIGLTFAASLRSILRHDPDVVLVGEIRDHETAENAIQASLTGHLVFSTLHTNDAPSAYTRLVDMGIEPFLVASTIEGVMAQRLVRRLCKKCREEHSPKRDELPDDFPWEEYQALDRPIYRNTGCRICRGSGFAGRQGIFELCETTEGVRQLAHDRASSWEIRKVALKEGMRTLRDDAWHKVLEGITTVDEVLRVTKSDRM